MEPLTFARFIPFDKRGQDSQRTKKPGAEIGDGYADPHGPPARFTGDRHQSSHALGNLIEARTLRIGPGLAETRYTGEDDARINRLEGDVIDAEARLDVWPKIFNHHIDGGGQAQKQLQPIRFLQIDR